MYVTDITHYLNWTKLGKLDKSVDLSSFVKKYEILFFCASFLFRRRSTWYRRESKMCWMDTNLRRTKNRFFQETMKITDNHRTRRWIIYQKRRGWTKKEGIVTRTRVKRERRRKSSMMIMNYEIRKRSRFLIVSLVELMEEMGNIWVMVNTLDDFFFLFQELKEKLGGYFLIEKFFG